MSIRAFSDVEGTFVLGLFAVMLLLLYLYAFEYVRYRTLYIKPKRKFNVILPLWMGFLGLYCLIRASFVVGLLTIGLSVLTYMWDKAMMKRLL